MAITYHETDDVDRQSGLRFQRPPVKAYEVPTECADCGAKIVTGNFVVQDDNRRLCFPCDAEANGDSGCEICSGSSAEECAANHPNI